MRCAMCDVDHPQGRSQAYYVGHDGRIKPRRVCPKSILLHDGKVILDTTTKGSMLVPDEGRRGGGGGERGWGGRGGNGGRGRGGRGNPSREIEQISKYRIDRINRDRIKNELTKEARKVKLIP